MEEIEGECEFDSETGIQWIETIPGGDTIGKRYGSTCHLLSKREEIIVIGGDYDKSDYYIYNIRKNEFIRKKSPFALMFHSSCFFSTTSSTFILVFGGCKKKDGVVLKLSEPECVSSHLYECQILSNSEVWRKISTKGRTKPCARNGHSCVASSDQRFMILFGGFNGSDFLNDLWKYDVKKQEWEEIKPSTDLSPPPRYAHSAVFLNNRMIIGCGVRLERCNHGNDFWVFNFSTLSWKQLHIKNQEKIIPRSFNQMIVLKNEKDEVQNILLGTGKYSNAIDLSKHQKDDLTSFWILNLSKKIYVWNKLSISRNNKILWSYSMLQFKNHVLIFGGEYGICPDEMKGSFYNNVQMRRKDFTRIGNLSLSLSPVTKSSEEEEEEEEEEREEQSIIRNLKHQLIRLRKQFKHSKDYENSLKGKLKEFENANYQLQLQYRTERRRLERNIHHSNEKFKEVNEKLRHQIIKNKQLKQTSQIGDLLKQFDVSEFLHFDPSFHFYEKSMIDFDQKIHNQLFHDKQGQEVTYRNYSHRRREIDGYSETTLWNPKEDLEIVIFIETLKQRYSLRWNDVHKKVRKTGTISDDFYKIIGEIMNEVSNYFGGIRNPQKIDDECDQFITKYVENANLRRKEEGMNTCILLSKFKGKGVCRHRALLFKIICDSLGIRCRLTRGSVNVDDEMLPHVWNYVYFNGMMFLVDCFSQPLFANEQRNRFLRYPKIIEVDDNLPLSEYYKNIVKLYYPLGHQKYQEKRRIVKFCKDNLPAWRQIGGGQYGDVFKVTDQRKSKTYAIKRMKERNNYIFRRETTLMGLMNHPNIIPYFGKFEYKDFQEIKYHCFVMDHLKPRKDGKKKNNSNGEEFVKFLRTNTLRTIEKTINSLVFLISVSKGLRYLHSLDIVYFDLKLDNIVCEWKSDHLLGKVCLIDFGGSKEKLSNLFSSGMLVANLLYASPELRKCQSEFLRTEDPKCIQRITSSTDIYSFGKMVLSEFMGFNFGKRKRNEEEEEEEEEEREEERKENFLEGLFRVERLFERCIHDVVERRPSLGEIISVLIQNLKYVHQLSEQVIQKKK